MWRSIEFLPTCPRDHPLGVVGPCLTWSQSSPTCSRHENINCRPFSLRTPQDLPMGYGRTESLQSLAFLSIALKLLLSEQRVLNVVVVKQEKPHSCLFPAALNQFLPAPHPLDRRPGGVAPATGKNSHTTLYSLEGQVGIVPGYSASSISHSSPDVLS